MPSRSSNPASAAQEPGHVRHRGRRPAHHGRPLHPDRRRAAGLHPPDLPLALVHRPVRQFRRGHGRRPGQGPGRRAAQDPDRTPSANRLPGRTVDRARSRPNACGRATSSSSPPARSSRPTARSIEGIATVDESAITGESAPVIREAGGDRSAVTGGTRVLSDRIIVRVTADPGEELPRPHDRPRRGRAAAEDAERDRPDHSALGPDDHLPGRRSSP